MGDAQGPGTEVSEAVQAACDECYLALAQGNAVEPFAVFGPPAMRGGLPLFRMADLRAALGGWPLPEEIWSAAVADLCERGGHDEVAVAYPAFGALPAPGGTMGDAVAAAERAAAGAGPADAWVVVHHQVAGGPVRSFRADVAVAGGAAQLAGGFVECDVHLRSGPASALTLVRPKPTPEA